MKRISLVLFQPEIPQNTGNIARLSVALGAELVLVGPLGFSIDERAVKRAGLDYWQQVRLGIFENDEAFFRRHSASRLVGVDPKGRERYDRFRFEDGDMLCFGRESVGLGFLPEASVHIPMAPGCRSINLANAVAIVGFEAMKGELGGSPPGPGWAGTISSG